MINPKVVFAAKSQNGRWGVEVVCQAENWQTPEGSPLIVRGTIQSIGAVSGVACYEVYPDETGQTWVLMSAGTTDYVPVQGATTVCSVDLQGNSSATILIIGPIAVVRGRGYKGRSSWYTLYKEGIPQPLSECQLLALGLIDPETRSVPPLDPPPVDSAFAQALRKAGL